MKDEVKSVWICGSFTFNLIVVGNLKTVSVMANFRLVFQGTEKSKTLDSDLEVYVNPHNEISIYLETDGVINMVCLDKDTAVKFSKELRRQIGYLESEVNNG